VHVHVQPATARHLPSILEIENDAIESTFAHFGTEPVTLQALTCTFENAEGRYPWLVCLDGDQVLGFARSGPWKSRQGYHWTAEVGVYVRQEHQGKGVGKALYRELFPALKAVGFRTIVAGIALPNDASVRLHEAYGMEQIGTFPKNGFKHGAWWDVGYWSLHWETE
jgi:phosphinothricin acetyltransferase